MNHLLTIDIEEWFRNDFPGNNPKLWHTYDDRILLEVPYILNLLNKNRQHATFFVLGVVAQKYPALIRQMHQEGHEVASHGMYHHKVNKLSQRQFRKDLQQSLGILQKITQIKIQGFRAPYWSVANTTPAWFYSELGKAGLTYSSSIMPVQLGIYGDWKSSTFLHRIPAGRTSIREFPVATAGILGARIPVGVGVYLRLYPYWLTKYLVTLLEQQQRTTMFMIHNWELDPYHPRIPIRFPYNLGHYGGLKQFPQRFEQLLRDYRCTSISRYLHRDFHSVDSSTLPEPD